MLVTRVFVVHGGSSEKNLWAQKHSHGSRRARSLEQMFSELLLMLSVNPHPWYSMEPGRILSNSDMCVFCRLCNSIGCEAKNWYIGVL